MPSTPVSVVRNDHTPELAPSGRTLRVFGMQRSGNHAVIAWLRRNISESDTIFLNNCSKGDPMQTFASVEARGELYLFRVRKKAGHHKYPRLLHSRETLSNHIVSYENRPPRVIAPTGTEPVPGYSADTQWANVFICRSFLNWLASYYKLKLERHPRPLEHIKSEALRIYADHLEDAEALSDTRLTTILYDQWATDPDYRLSRLAALGITPLDNSTGEVTTRFGGGSSFGENHKSAAQIATSLRWKALSDVEEFQEILATALADERLVALLSQRFPDDLLQARKILEKP